MTDDGLHAGELLADRYRLIDRIGAGGMSVIWRAHDATLDRLVAVKVLDLELSGDERLRELARREAWAVARLNHPDVAGVHDFVRTVSQDGSEIALIVLQLVAGEQLADRIAMGPMAWREAVRIGARIATVLEVAHRRGVVHRDITPDNVMLHGEQVTVLDFGIAARIGEPDDDSTGASFGTPAYIAPERLDGTPARAATDVYALGVVLFEMLTGRPPYRVRGWVDVAADHGPVPVVEVPGLPRAVTALMTRCLQRDPADRPEAAEAARVLRSALSATAGPVPPRTAAVLAGSALAAAVVLAITWTLSAGRDPGGTTGSPSVSAPGPAVLSPSGGLPSSPGPSGGLPSAAAPGSAPAASAGPSVRATGPGQPSSVSQALSAALRTIDAGAAQGAIRVDVAQDMRNLMRNLVGGRTAGQALGKEINMVREKLDAREREGSISAQVAATLRSNLDSLAGALRAPRSDV